MKISNSWYFGVLHTSRYMFSTPSVDNLVSSRMVLRPLTCNRSRTGEEDLALVVPALVSVLEEELEQKLKG